VVEGEWGIHFLKTLLMYLANLKLWNFRKFGDTKEFNLKTPHLDLNFKLGLNVLVGENDSGKSAILDSIKHVLKTHSYEWIRIAEEDFYQGADRLRIEILFAGLTDDEAKNFTEWLGWIGEAEEAVPYLRLIYDVNKTNSRILPSEIRAGVDDAGYQMSAEAKEYLKITYLKALRDASGELVPKKNSRLSQILQNHEAFKDAGSEHYLLNLLQVFNEAVEKYFEAKGIHFGEDGTKTEGDIADDRGKKLKQEIDGYIKSFFDPSKVTEISIVEANLKALLEKLELTVKDDFNPGLGSLNRLFMASELLHLNKTDWTGLRLGLIEELEAHLHPQSQMQVIEALQKISDIQLILTTHSPNLASKVKLDNLILCKNSNAYPLGKEYTKLDDDDYIFLEKFLDVTKANLFFAKGIILVEGWSEEIFIPSFTKLLKKQGIISKDLTEAGVAIINVGSKAYLRYSRIFLRQQQGQILPLPVSIVTDVDIPKYAKQLMTDEEGKVLKNDKGKPKYECIARDPLTVAQETQKVLEEAEAYLNEDPVKLFIAPEWTFEYCLYKSTSLGNLFIATSQEQHPKMDKTNFEQELAKKLLIQSLNKTEIAYSLSLQLEDAAIKSDMKVAQPDADESDQLEESDDENKNSTDFRIQPEDPSIAYLINAIKYAIGD
jgi:putative ATP-dependent endonuclease of OLD family